MKISYNWLKEYIDFKQSPEELSKILTGTGLEVEGLAAFESIKGGLEGVVIGEVLTCLPHPNADKLKLTTVDIGGKISPIVCGAPNVAAGQKVVVATLGTTLYPVDSDSFNIKKAKIRGEVSEGMLCAEDELGLGKGHDGILVLDTTLPNGTPAADYFKVERDHVFEIGLTPNRVDAASHYGVARDIKAVLGHALTFPDYEKFKISSTTSPFKVKIENQQSCLRYAGLSIANIKVGASPDWLKNRLQAIGVNSINNVVDITNYVLHGIGQPLHAFDASSISGDTIYVKNLKEGTSFVTLDEKEVKLKSSDLMICDDKGGLCIAGVMGGASSGVTDSTTTVFLESAYFVPDTVRKTSMAHGLKTDAAFRFERGVDPNMTIKALKLAAVMICDIAGGEVSSDVIDIYPDPVKNHMVEVSFRNIDRLIGKSLGEEKIREILRGLEIGIQTENDGSLMLEIPAYRVDVQREADVIEEILRIYGYDNIALSEHLGAASLAHFPTHDERSLVSRAADLLVGSGFYEIMTSSLTTPEYVMKTGVGKEEENVAVLNKLSEDLGVLRQSMLFGGLESIVYNVNRKSKNLKFFDFGNTYLKKGDKYKQHQKLALFMTGHDNNDTWVRPNKSVDFYDISEIVLKLLRKFGVVRFSKQNSSSPMFSYGLEITVDDKAIVQFGKVNDQICEVLQLEQEVFYAEIDWSWMTKKFTGEVTAVPVSKFPTVKRDLSLVLDKAVTFDEVRALALKAEKKLLRDISVFSVYEGENIEKGKKSYAISFLLHDDEKTLSDKIIDKTMARLIKSFENELGALIRK